MITIKDIAKELGISPSTVSRALKDHPDISEPTKKAVQELAEKYNYSPNAVALSLRSKKTNVIGVIIPEIVHFFFSSVISGVEQIAEQNGYSVMVCQSGESFEREVKNVNTMISSRIDGVLISMSKHTKDFQHFYNLQKENIPIVFFDRVCPDIRVDRVIVDDYVGAFAAVEHMIERGCKRIAYLSAPRHLLIALNRWNGYKNALTKHKISYDEDLVIDCDDRETALKEVPALFETNNPPDGIFAVNDYTATGVITALRKLGKRIPEDVAVAGYSNSLVAQVIDPSLTTVDQHGVTIGNMAAKLLIDRIEGRAKDSYITKMVKTTLEIRESTVGTH